MKRLLSLYTQFKITTLFFVLILLIFILWNGIISFFHIPTFILPSPNEILMLIWRDHTYFFHHSRVTFFEALFGLLIAISGGLLAGVLMTFSGKATETTVLPLAVMLQSVPIVALAPLFSIWFGIGFFAKVVLVAVLCWFPVVINTSKGLISIRRDQLDLMRIFQATRWQLLMRLQLPSGIPFMFAGMKIVAGLSVMGAIVAEYSGANAGLGYVITQSSYRLDTTRLFGAIFCAACESLMLYGVFFILESKVFSKYTIESG